MLSICLVFTWTRWRRWSSVANLRFCSLTASKIISNSINFCLTLTVFDSYFDSQLLLSLSDTSFTLSSAPSRRAVWFEIYAHIFHWHKVFSEIQERDLSLWELDFLQRNSFLITRICDSWFTPPSSVKCEWEVRKWSFILTWRKQDETPEDSEMTPELKENSLFKHVCQEWYCCSQLSSLVQTAPHSTNGTRLTRLVLKRINRLNIQSNSLFCLVDFSFIAM